MKRLGVDEARVNEYFKVKGEDFLEINTFQDFYNYCQTKVQEKATI